MGLYRILNSKCKKHVNSFSELDKETRVEVGNVIAYAEKALRELKMF